MLLRIRNLPFCVPYSPSESDPSHPKSDSRSKMNTSYQGNFQKPPRRDCHYSPEEIEQINPFKADYKKATQAERLITMKTKILPAMFNYWTAQGQWLTQEDGPAKAQVSMNN